MNLLLETEEGVLRIGDAPADSDAPTVAVIPGADVSLHRLTLLEVSGPARLAEARMRATDLSGQPIEDVHVAVGPAEPDGASWIALIDRTAMAGHVAHLSATGSTARHIVPAALLLPPAGATPSMARFGDRVLLRTTDLAGLVEPSLASALTGASQLGRFVQLGEFAPAETPDPLPLDLLQGEFAPRVRWWANRRFQIAAAALTLLVLALLAAPLLIDRARTAATIAAYDRAVIELAAQALGTRPADAQSGAAALADARRSAEGAALGARLSHAARTIEAVPGARLDSARLQPDGTLILVLGGETDAINRVGPLLAGGPFQSSADATRIVMVDRQAGRAVSDTPLSKAMLRLVAARQDAAVALAGRARPQLTADAVQAAFVASGLIPPAQLAGPPAGGSISVPAARSTALLPAIADLELKGARFNALTLVRNADETLSANLGVAQ